MVITLRGITNNVRGISVVSGEWLDSVPFEASLSLSEYRATAVISVAFGRKNKMVAGQGPVVKNATHSHWSRFHSGSGTLSLTASGQRLIWAVRLSEIGFQDNSGRHLYWHGGPCSRQCQKIQIR